MSRTRKRGFRREPTAAPPLRAWPRVLKLCWWAICLGVLAGWLLMAARSDSGAEDRDFLLMLALLSFPAGLVWLWFVPDLSAILASLGVDPATLPRHWELAATWAGVVLLGHVQWFWLLPAAFRLRAEG